MKLFLSVLICAVAASSAIYCGPEACKDFECEPVEECDGRLEPNGGYCGCCETCVVQLGEGEVCPPLLFGAPLYTECASGLYCDQDSLLCSQLGECQAEYDRKSQITEPVLGLDLPECEDDGTFSPKQCTEAVCYCVSAEGNRIGGKSDVWEADEVTCECQRERYETMIGEPKMGAFIPECNASGDYKAVQCHGSVCYCVESSHGNKIEGSEKHISEYINMKC
ncbi:saxiphilin-like [Antedon mediterranea]|uniref:saxiphilin-like n=1 Tax=Antedon mediterranea TaxID=105859 RepID=UPI003AF43D4B